MIPNIIEPSSSITLASTWATQRITKLSNYDTQKGRMVAPLEQ